MPTFLAGEDDEGMIDLIYVTGTNYITSGDPEPNASFSTSSGVFKNGAIESLFDLPDDEEHLVIETAKNNYLTLTSKTRVLNDNELPTGTGGGNAAPTTTQIWRTG